MQLATDPARPKASQRYTATCHDPGYAAALGSLLVLVAGCSWDRDLPDGGKRCVTWQDDIEAAFEARCVHCHGGSEPAANYSLERYTEVLGRGSDDTPNVRVDDEASTLLRKLDPRRVNEAHLPFVELRAMLRRWTIQCDLAYGAEPIHRRGILNPRDEDFHAHLLRRSGWDFARCAECHGEEFGGGVAEAPCTTCHDNGPTSCETCHTSALRSDGAHDAHLSGNGMTLHFEECRQCHRTPSSHDSDGHILREGRVDEPPAEIVFGPTAVETGEGGMRNRPPSYERSTGTCNAVYCHGATMRDPAATRTAPRWFRSDAGQAACGTCHGVPPADHAQDRCGDCHGPVTGERRRIDTPALHVDGTIQIGRPGEDGCTRCHGEHERPAPPPDVQGREASSVTTVGAHRSHLDRPFRLRGPITCRECHRVPEALEDTGHIDEPRPAEVFPEGEARGDTLAAANGAQPSWNHQDATCARVYCHGAGRPFQSNATKGLNRRPKWTRVDTGEASCGSCHGIPPADDVHDGELGLRDCARCHTSVDEFGNIIVNTSRSPMSEHIDGDIDVR